MPLLNVPQQRVLASHSANSAAFALTAGYKLLSGLSATSVGRVPMAAADGTNARRGVRLVFFGTGADNATFTARLWVVRYSGRAADAPAPTHGTLRYWGSVAVTLSASVGVASGLIAAADRLADTLAFTAGSAASSPKGISVVRETAVGSGGTAAYSPADDTPAHLEIPDLGGEDELLVEFSTTGGGTATGMNALAEAGV